MQGTRLLSVVRRPKNGGHHRPSHRPGPPRSAGPPVCAPAAVPASLSLCLERAAHERGAALLPARRVRRHPTAREAGPRARGGVCGSVTFIQRFGLALNLTPHFHALVLDGVYEGGASTPGRFLALDPPETDDVAGVLAGTARRIRRRLEALGIEEGEDRLAEDEPLLAMLTAASIRSRIATGPEVGLASFACSPWRRLGDRVEAIADDEQEEGVEPGAGIPPRCVRQGGMSLHADVAVPGRDRPRLERLCRYVARPPLALERLEELRDDRLVYRLETPWRDGTTHVVMERTELLERLAPLVPPPRAHQVRYHGVLAPCASGRDRVVRARVERSQEQVAPRGGPRADVGGGATWRRLNGPRESSSVDHLAASGIEPRDESGAVKPNEVDDGSRSAVLSIDSPTTEARAGKGKPSPAATWAPADRRRDSRRMAWADLN